MKTLGFTLAAGLMAASFAAPAQAGSGFSFSYSTAPAYYAAPTYYQPQPVYYAPQPVYYSAPGFYAPYTPAYRVGYWNHDRSWGRNPRRGHHGHHWR